MLRSIRLFILLSILSVSILGQEFKFSQFNIKDGLNDPFVYSIANDYQGYLCVGTGEGLGMFDGQKFQMKYAKDGLAEDFVSSLLLSKNGTLWIGHKEGGVSIYENGVFSVFDNLYNFESIITSITEDDQGSIWISSQSHGIVKIKKGSSQLIGVPNFDEKIINNTYVSKEKLLYVSTDMGLEIYDVSKKDWSNLTIQKKLLEDYNIIEVTPWGKSKLLIATSSSGFYQYNMVTETLQQIEIPEDVIIKDISVDLDNNIFISSIDQGLIKIDINFFVTIYNDENGLASNAVNHSFMDREGILWMGSYGSGLFRFDNEIFTNYFSVKEDEEGEIRDVLINERYKYFLYSSMILRVELESFNSPDIFKLGDTQSMNSIYVDDNHNMFVGTDNNGVHKIDPITGLSKKLPFSDDNLSQNISDIEGDKGVLWIGTYNGVFKLDLVTQEVLKFDISNGLSHNSVNTLFLEKKSKRLYVGCKSSKLNYIDNNDEVKEINYFESTKVYNVYGINVDQKGQLLIATYGDGLLIQSDGEFYSVSSSKGLLSNFCYAIISDVNGEVWVTHNGGLSNLNLETSNLKTFSEKESVSYKYSRGAISRDKSFIWFGTSTGALKFDASIKDENEVPPALHIESIIVNGEEISLSKDIELQHGYHDFKFVVKGLSLRNPKKVKYKFMLEGYNQNWTDVSTDNRFNLAQVSDGTYQLKVVAYNEDMVGSSESEVFFTIVIHTPFWKRIWFWALMILAVIFITYLIIKFRERRYRLRQQELEDQLEIRTKEVTEQKDKVLSINKDITDSINYAKRIQDAVLPSDNTFNTKFPNSFVVYKPRDIVSGDFYWTNSTTDKLLIGCGDCTGHGVPGAFMSLLGQQMLKEIYSIKKIQEPNMILSELNSEIRMLMSEDTANQDEYLMVDGMDIIITEFNFKKMELKWSSAIRPLLRYRNEKREYLKGSRSSIGSATSVDAFTLNTDELIVGDMLYMFSDGFPDQFGGDNHKKLKTSGMFKILDEAQSLPIDQQKDFIENHLTNWMGETEQTDDIIIIGIKI